MRTQEIVVLLVEPQAIPQRLAQAFNPRHCWVESVELAHVAPAVVAAQPELLVCRERHVRQVLSLLEATGQTPAAGTWPQRLVVVLEPHAEHMDDGELAGSIRCVVPYAATEEELGRTIWANLPSRTAFEAEPHRVGDQHVAPTVRPPPLPADAVHPPTASSTHTPTRSDSGRRRVKLGATQTGKPLQLIVRSGAQPEWAEAVVRVLRAAGHSCVKVHQSAAETPWHALREQAPTAVIMPETGPCHDQGEWLTALRSDPFLSWTPLLTLPRSPGCTSRGLLDLAASLNDFESRLEELLRPGREVSFDLCQIGVTRLLRLLQSNGVHAQLSAGIAGQILRWGVRGKAATAGLLESEKRVRVTADDALGWLLDHPGARVALRVVQRLSVRPTRAIDTLLSDKFLVIPPPFHRVSGFRPAVGVELGGALALDEYRERLAALKPWAEQQSRAMEVLP